MARRLSKKALAARDELYAHLAAEAQSKAEAHHAHAMSKGGAWSFSLKDGRQVTVEATRIGVIASDPALRIVFQQRTDGGAHPVWFRVSVDGELFGDDGWLGFHDASTEIAIEQHIAWALGGEV